MPQTQVSCPRCRQPVPANVEQLFDVTSDPGAKQRLLGGVSNMIRCPFCGHEGRLATPIVYHDNEKELLLTFFPPELGLPLNEQEKLIGPLIKQVMDRLPAEKRKAYLLSPKPNLTFESMIELILGKDGITPEMIKSQQERVTLIDRLLQASSADVRSEIIKQNEKVIDDQFFALFGRLAQSAASQQPKLGEALVALQDQLLKETEFGRGLAESVGEMEAAAKSLQEAGQGLTREKLLDFVIAAPSDARIRAYVNLARGGMDYSFFQTLTEKIEKASPEEKTKLEAVREKLLEYTNEVDRQIEARYKQAQKFIESLLAQDDITAATQANLQNFSQDAVDIVQQMLRQASEKNDYAMMGKLQKMVEALQQASAPPEMGFIEQLLEAPDAAAIEKMLNDNADMVNDQFLEALNGLVAQIEQQGQGNPEAQAISEKLSAVYKVALKFSMKKNMG
ncbi:MAG: hypothetical protein HY867_17340 [Chloroflexi bacterium]|nr:hypothetical protein [Chloroflexota bacterium]